VITIRVEGSGTSPTVPCRHKWREVPGSRHRSWGSCEVPEYLHEVAEYWCERCHERKVEEVCERVE